MSSLVLYTCSCCGYKTKSTPYFGSYEICPVCFWEDDDSQVENPDMAGGANPMSLRDAQKNFKKVGACEIAMLQHVVKDRSGYELDSKWKALDE